MDNSEVKDNIMQDLLKTAKGKWLEFMTFLEYIECVLKKDPMCFETILFLNNGIMSFANSSVMESVFLAIENSPKRGERAMKQLVWTYLGVEEGDDPDLKRKTKVVNEITKINFGDLLNKDESFRKFLVTICCCRKIGLWELDAFNPLRVEYPHLDFVFNKPFLAEPDRETIMASTSGAGMTMACINPSFIFGHSSSDRHQVKSDCGGGDYVCLPVLETGRLDAQSTGGHSLSVDKGGFLFTREDVIKAMDNYAAAHLIKNRLVPSMGAASDLAKPNQVPDGLDCPVSLVPVCPATIFPVPGATANAMGNGDGAIPSMATSSRCVTLPGVAWEIPVETPETNAGYGASSTNLDSPSLPDLK